ncbi:MAG: flippase [Ramlibacter sp.]|nr:flippase [Ramlibacter sp.]
MAAEPTEGRYLDRLKALFGSRGSRLGSHALWMFLFNMLSNALLLVGNTYAARCLGPLNIGVSAQVQALSQQAGLAYNGGFDAVAVRAIAADRACAAPLVQAIVTFRLVVALLLATGWVLAVLILQPVGAVRVAWLLGAGLIVIGSLNVSFIYQALERLPVQAAISSVAAIAIALGYALLFTPGMQVGSDLMLIVVVTALSSAIAIAGALKLAGLAPGGTSGLRDGALALRGLLEQSWRYWLLAVVIYVYSAFPILLVAHFHGDAAAGIFRVCFVMAAALELVFASINNLLLPRLVSWRADGVSSMWKKQSDLARFHVVFGCAVCVAALLCAPYVFGHFLGPEYLPGLPVFNVLVAGRLVVFVSQIYAWGLVALRLDSQFLKASLAGAVASLLLNFALIPRLSMMGAAITSLAAEAIIGVLCYLLQRRSVSAQR